MLHRFETVEECRAFALSRLGGQVGEEAEAARNAIVTAPDWLIGRTFETVDE